MHCSFSHARRDKWGVSVRMHEPPVDTHIATCRPLGVYRQTGTIRYQFLARGGQTNLDTRCLRRPAPCVPLHKPEQGLCFRTGAATCARLLTVQAAWPSAGSHRGTPHDILTESKHLVACTQLLFCGQHWPPGGALRRVQEANAFVDELFSDSVRLVIVLGLPCICACLDA